MSNVILLDGLTDTELVLESSQKVIQDLTILLDFKCKQKLIGLWFKNTGLKAIGSIKTITLYEKNMENEKKVYSLLLEKVILQLINNGDLVRWIQWMIQANYNRGQIDRLVMIRKALELQH